MEWQLAHPAWLALLLLAPVLVFLHFARRRPRQVDVPFLRLWERAQPRRRIGLKRLRDLAALALALAVLALVCLALARPFRPPPPPEDVLIVLDDTASMEAVDADGADRFRKAVTAIASAVRASPPRVRFALALTAGAARVEIPFDAGRERILAALESARAKALGGDAAGAVRSLAPLVDGTAGTRVWVAADVPPGSIPEATAGGTPVETLAFGDRADNLRIAAFSGHWGSWWDAAASLFVRAENAGPEGAAGRLSVRAGEESVLERDFSLGPGKGFEITLAVSRREGRWASFSAGVSPGGALAWDDRAWCAVPPVERKRVLLVSANPTPFLRAALQGLEAFADRERSGEVDGADWEKALKPGDLSVFEGAGPGKTFPAGGSLVLGAAPETLPGPPPGPVQGEGSVVDWDREHPVTRGLSFDNAFFRSYRPLPPDYHPLLSVEGGTVAGAREGPGGRAVVLSASLSETNLGLLPAFPIFVRNALEWVGEREDAARGPGRGGKAERWIEGREGGPGLAVSEGKPLAVNFFDEGESRLRAPATGDARGFRVPAPGKPAADPWPALLWAALAALSLHWALLFTPRGRAQGSRAATQARLP